MDVPKWKQYEWLVTKIYHDDCSCIDTYVYYDNQIDGVLSNTTRQIDALVIKHKDESDFRTILDCKYYNRNIDIKKIESFLGMKEDVNAEHGILVTNIGYTSGAINRVENRYDITLEVIPWMDGFYNSLEIPNNLNDLCSKCLDGHKRGKYIPGILLWELGYALEIENILYLFGIGKCMKCKTKHLWCDSCGTVNHVDHYYLCSSCGIYYNRVEEFKS